MTWLPTPITTDRLVLRPLTRGDEKPIAELFLDAEVRRFLGGPLTKREARRRARVVNAGATDRYWGVFGVVEQATNDVAGMVSFDQRRGPWQLNYEFRPQWWGRGLALEACTATLAWFWTHRPEVPQVVVITQAANDRSSRLLELLGARSVREFPEFGAVQREFVLCRPPAEGDSGGGTA